MSEFSDWERRGDGPYHTDPKLQREAAFNAGRTIGRAEGMELAAALIDPMREYPYATMYAGIIRSVTNI